MCAKKYLYIALSILLFIFACKKKNNNIEQHEVQQEDSISKNEINLPATNFDNNWNKIYKNANSISQAEYDSLGLANLTFLMNYSAKDLVLGTRLISEPNRKLFSIKTAGESAGASEISEYLLAYVENTITDSLLIAYEDNVAYMSATSSTVKGDTITVKTINWSYEDMNNPNKSDTLVTQYIITPKLKFEEIIEE